MTDTTKPTGDDLMKRAQDRLIAEMKAQPRDAWKTLFWGVAGALGCLPSSFVDGNEHVLQRATEAHLALVGLTPSPSVHRQASAEPTDLCPGCHGSGEQQFMTQHLGPNDYEVAGQCSKCGGTGACQSRQASAGQEGVTEENIRSLWQTTDTGDVETDIMSFARSLLALPNHWRSALEFYADQSNWTSCSAMERGPRVDEDGGDMARAALSTAAPESGWRLVPVEATEAMVLAGARANGSRLFDHGSTQPLERDGPRTREQIEQIKRSTLATFNAMLAAAPTAGETL